MAARISIHDYPACLLDGAALASQTHEIHTQARAQAAARISLDPDRLALSQGLDHPSKADASYGSIHIQPRSKVLPVEVEGKVAQTPLAGCLYLKHGPLAFHGIT